MIWQKAESSNSFPALTASFRRTRRALKKPSIDSSPLKVYDLNLLSAVNESAFGMSEVRSSTYASTTPLVRLFWNVHSSRDGVVEYTGVGRTGSMGFTVSGSIVVDGFGAFVIFRLTGAQLIQTPPSNFWFTGTSGIGVMLRDLIINKRYEDVIDDSPHNLTCSDWITLELSTYVTQLNLFMYDPVPKAKALLAYDPPEEFASSLGDHYLYTPLQTF
ncbi:hypothetical protein DFH05DRAFT_1520939 [Lentinula detonsa]|uniref:Uncharacterized protein n=1 Tax=Lentinula detonsa TaxID=2804962 RepID=A0A9W8P8W3_9AGAR|nr:hypothetical protein DFH05DRAFT_1520939 [Lentinula detonsa]